MWRRRVGSVFFLVCIMFSGWFVGFVGFAQDNIRDQVITNTQRLNNIERELNNLQQGGSNAAQLLAVKVGVLENRLDASDHEVDSLRAIVYGSLTFGILQLVAVMSFFLRAWFSWVNKAQLR
jgi:hypothetical protein